MATAENNTKRLYLSALLVAMINPERITRLKHNYLWNVGTKADQHSNNIK